MLRSLYSGVAGLNAHQTRMDVIGNNISNVNTAGYKASRVTFKDVYYQTLTGGADPNTSMGGVNSQQVGYGAQLGSINVLHTNSGLTTTGSPMDCYVGGDGFFVVKSPSGQEYYKRLGDLKQDNAGNITDTEGNFVYGWPAVRNGNDLDFVKATPVAATTNLGGVLVNFGEALGSALNKYKIVVKQTQPDAAGVYPPDSSILDTTNNTITVTTNVKGSGAGNHPTTYGELLLAIQGTQMAVNDKGVSQQPPVVPDGGDLLALMAGVSFRDPVNPDENIPLTQTIPTAGDAIPAGAFPNGSIAKNGKIGDAQLSPALTTLLNRYKVSVSDGNPSSAKLDLNTAPPTLNITLAPQATYANLLTELKSLFVTATNVTPPTTLKAPGGTFLVPNAMGNVGLDSVSAGYLDGYKIIVKQGTTSAQSVLNSNNKTIEVTLDLNGGANYTQFLEALRGVVAEVGTTPPSALPPGFNRTNIAFQQPEADKKILEFADTHATYPVKTTPGSDTPISANNAIDPDDVNKNTVTIAGGVSIVTGQTHVDNAKPPQRITLPNLLKDTNGDGLVDAEDKSLPGGFTNISIGPDGTITAVQGAQTLVLGQIALAKVPNPEGLTMVGNSCFQAQTNVGKVTYAVPGQDGTGSLTTGALESSNVNLSNEFSEMIITERGFQANSRIITVSDEMLQELVNLKR